MLQGQVVGGRNVDQIEMTARGPRHRAGGFQGFEALMTSSPVSSDMPERVNLGTFLVSDKVYSMISLLHKRVDFFAWSHVGMLDVSSTIA